MYKYNPLVDSVTVVKRLLTRGFWIYTEPTYRQRYYLWSPVNPRYQRRIYKFVFDELRVKKRIRLKEDKNYAETGRRYQWWVKK